MGNGNVQKEWTPLKRLKSNPNKPLFFSLGSDTSVCCCSSVVVVQVSISVEDDTT